MPLAHGDVHASWGGNTGLKFVAEKVCHHPTIVAAHCESPNFVFHQDQQPSTKFWGKSIELTSSGTIHVELPRTGDHFTWHKVTTCMRNIFSDARKLEHYGDMTVRNLTTGDYCVLTFKVRLLRTGQGARRSRQLTPALWDTAAPKKKPAGERLL